MSQLQLSYSSIKDFEVLTPQEWKSKWIDRNFPKEIKRAFSFGSLLDCILFEPDLLDKKFIITNNPLPSDAVCGLVTNVIDLKVKLNNIRSVEENIEDYTDELKQVLIETGYWKSRKPDTNLKNVLKDGAEYFKALNTSNSKTIVSQADLDKCLRMRDNAYLHRHAKQFLIAEEETELSFQCTFKVPYTVNNGQVILKAIFDCQYINHKNKTMRVVDLKSTGQGSQFQQSVIKYRYGAQMGVYNYALSEVLKAQNSEYVIEPPINLVIDKTTEQIQIYNYTWRALELERYGNGHIKGWHFLIEEILERHNTNNWEND